MSGPRETDDFLRAYGWSRQWERRLQALGRPALEPGRVIRAHRGVLTLETGRGPLAARLSGRRAHLAKEAAELAVVGDWVAFERAATDGPAVVHEILERRNRLSRKVAGERSVEQLVAANVDQVLLVMGLDGDYNLRRLERFLAMAGESGARPAVVLNKLDLCSDVEPRFEAVRALCSGSPVVALSALAGDLDALELLLTPAETVAFVGSSGAGKSTLINRLLGKDAQRTLPVRAGDSRGRHATTHRELFRLPGGCLVIDNPGVREIQLWSASGVLPEVFDDVERWARGCRFGDCRHGGEPDCAVQEAIRRGDLDPARLESWRRLEHEAAALELRKDARARRQRDRELGKLYRSIQREKRDRR